MLSFNHDFCPLDIKVGVRIVARGYLSIVSSKRFEGRLFDIRDGLHKTYRTMLFIKSDLEIVIFNELQV